MKNLPESRLWDKIKSRLRSYEEEPDDRWDAIMAGVRTQSSASGDLATKSLWVILVLLLGWLGVPEDAGGSRSFIGALGGHVNGVAEKNHDSEKIIVDADSTTVDESTTKSRRHDASALREGGDSGEHKVKIQRHNTGKNLPSVGRRDVTVLSSRTYEHYRVNANTNATVRNVVDGAQQEHPSTLSLEKNEELEKVTATPSEKVIETAPDSASHNGNNAQVHSEDLSAEKNTRDESKREQRKRRPVLIYASITPSLAYYNITPDKKDEVQLKELKSKGIFSMDRLGFTLDIGLYRQLTRKLEGYAGLSYYQQRQNVSFTYVSDESSTIAINDKGNYSVTPGTKTRQVSYAMRNVGVAAGILYTVKRETLNHQVGLGFQYYYGLSRISYEEAIDNDAVSYFNYQIMYRLRWNVAPRLDFYLQPSYTSSLRSQQNDYQPFAIKPSRAGIGFGMIYFLR
jgi:hypothetical protein